MKGEVTIPVEDFKKFLDTDRNLKEGLKYLYRETRRNSYENNGKTTKDIMWYTPKDLDNLFLRKNQELEGKNIRLQQRISALNIENDNSELNKENKELKQGLRVYKLIGLMFLVTSIIVTFILITNR